MPAPQKETDPLPEARSRADWLAKLESPSEVGGLPGPGRWFIFRYLPTALFSLKTSTATSTVGKTLLVPTPYAIKMAMIDAAFRSAVSDEHCASLAGALALIDLRIAPPERAVVTHTFVKIRQEKKVPDPLRPYGSNIAYREFVHYRGLWRWAFDLGTADRAIPSLLAYVAPRVNYIGKRGSFVQYVGAERHPQLGVEFTAPMPALQLPARSHGTVLDDFGPEATLDVLSSFSSAKAKVGPHRRYVDTLVPIGVTDTGPGFTEYSAT